MKKLNKIENIRNKILNIIASEYLPDYGIDVIIKYNYIDCVSNIIIKPSNGKAYNLKYEGIDLTDILIDASGPHIFCEGKFAIQSPYDRQIYHEQVIHPKYIKKCIMESHLSRESVPYSVFIIQTEKKEHSSFLLHFTSEEQIINTIELFKTELSVQAIKNTIDNMIYSNMNINKFIDYIKIKYKDNKNILDCLTEIKFNSI